MNHTFPTKYYLEKNRVFQLDANSKINQENIENHTFKINDLNELNNL